MLMTYIVNLLQLQEVVVVVDEAEELQEEMRSKEDDRKMYITIPFYGHTTRCWQEQ